MDGLVQALLSVIATLIGGLMLVVRANMKRGDEHADRADRRTEKLIELLERAVGGIDDFKREDTQLHAAIVETQKEILLIVERIESKLDRARGSPPGCC